MKAPELLIGGASAFDEILRLIGSARSTIVINMFIWRADSIGCAVAGALLDAADRGVKVEISVDRYGFVLEKCEESTHSFFHSKPTVSESVKIASLKLLYPELHPKNPPCDTHFPLLERMLNHRNIDISRDVFKADHSKYYIFDDETLVLGGVNIEDKETGADISGRVYGDYMVKLTGREYVEAFTEKLKTGRDLLVIGNGNPGFGNENPDFGNESSGFGNMKPDGLRFTVNYKADGIRRFEMQKVYLDLINSAKRELVIVMAYFSPLPEFVTAILDAAERGVDVTVMIPERANFQNDLNRRTVKLLMKKSKGRVKVFMSKKMLHTKLMYSENTLSFGSTNITKKAFGQLSELNLTLDCGLEPCEALKNDIGRELAAALKVTDPKTIKYRHIMAWLEGFVV